MLLPACPLLGVRCAAHQVACLPSPVLPVRPAELEEQTVELMRKRVYDMAGILGKTVKVRGGGRMCRSGWPEVRPG